MSEHWNESLCPGCWEEDHGPEGELFPDDAYEVYCDDHFQEAKDRERQLREMLAHHGPPKNRPGLG